MQLITFDPKNIFLAILISLGGCLQFSSLRIGKELSMADSEQHLLKFNLIIEAMGNDSLKLSFEDQDGKVQWMEIQKNDNEKFNSLIQYITEMWANKERINVTIKYNGKMTEELFKAISELLKSTGLDKRQSTIRE